MLNKAMFLSDVADVFETVVKGLGCIVTETVCLYREVSIGATRRRVTHSYGFAILNILV